jgi:hypothetical protein
MIHPTLIIAARIILIIAVITVFEALCLYLRHRRELKERDAADHRALRTFAEHVAEQRRKNRL